MASASNETIRQLVAQLSGMLRELKQMIEKLPDDLYRTPHAPLESSVGAHTRHILECYQQFMSQRKTGTLNYDLRTRCQTLEESQQDAVKLIDVIQTDLATIHRDSRLQLTNMHKQLIETSIARELHHLTEHTIHHIATIVIACRLAQIPVAPQTGMSEASRSAANA